METEARPSRSASLRRPRPLLLLLLGVAIVVMLWMKFGSAGPELQPSNPRAPQARPGEAARVDPEALDVKLEALAAGRPDVGETQRNPFRFRPKVAPAPPPSAESAGRKPGPAPPPQPVGPPPPPPITVKFIGTMDLADGMRVALFTECPADGRRVSSRPVREGETIFGQYRLVKIGLTSVVVEHLDGRGRTTLPKTGQECVK